MESASRSLYTQSSSAGYFGSRQVPASRMARVPSISGVIRSQYTRMALTAGSVVSWLLDIVTFSKVGS
ncbi:hypothetical protein D3C77_676100 [compost metagenome]